jgi:hypothetical protein
MAVDITVLRNSVSVVESGVSSGGTYGGGRTVSAAVVASFELRVSVADGDVALATCAWCLNGGW